MQYIDFIKLSWKNFKRSPSFQKRLALKIFMGLSYFIILLYFIAISFLAYYVVKEKFPNQDAFLKGSEFVYILFFIAIYESMYINYNGLMVQHFMLLPIKKKKIINYHLLRVFFHPATVILMLIPITYAIILVVNGYNVMGVIAWLVAVVASLYTIIFLLFLSEKNILVSTIMSLGTFVLLLKMKELTSMFSPLGLWFHKVYETPWLSVFPLLILLAVYMILFRYFSKRFYIDTKIIKTKEKSKTQGIKWLNANRLSDPFIKNDVRMIWRNVRPRQGLFGGISMFIFAGLIFSGITAKMHLPYFYNIFVAIFLTGFFVVQFGGFFPAWDSEYYKLIMTQKINYRQYIESKWKIMALSVVLLTILSLPFIYFGLDVYFLIVAMAVFNLGVNIPMTLFTGLYNTNPIKLNQKVKAFQSNDSFNMKIFIYGILRIIIPIVIYIMVEKYVSSHYAMFTFVVMGVIGLLFRNKILDYLSKRYIARKYATIAAFSKAEGD